MNYDSDKDISDKLRKLVMRSEREAKKAVTKAAKVYKGNIRINTPVHEKQTHKQHAVEVLKISNYERDSFVPTKEVGFDKGKKRADGGWYIHFPDIGTKPSKRTLGQPPQHFMRRSMDMSKAPILEIYKKALEDIFDVK
ncbi:HK97-gp10 family putative phage morphogenesis protein [Staphylococcus felis]|uniref:HK97-gp10 family putative phage morphogenesis protein n=1 Tax=Staphylococcus felis TaxID=46127 RepID=UPI000E2483D0|nr:HK97-gp10 family putative phage morphogenesis protein [Staphylococcus felis]REI31454.1 hypothetical protein DOS80_05950 [Staphylococcus felis]